MMTRLRIATDRAATVQRLLGERDALSLAQAASWKRTQGVDPLWNVRAAEYADLTRWAGFSTADTRMVTAFGRRED